MYILLGLICMYYYTHAHTHTHTHTQGWQSGDIHLAMDGHDRMGFPHMYKSKRATTLLHKVQAKVIFYLFIFYFLL